MKLRELANKDILILGFAREGIDSYLALRKLFPQKKLAIADKNETSVFCKRTQSFLRKDKNLSCYFGHQYLSSLKKYDLILKTPGIPMSVLRAFLKKGAVVLSQTEIFFANFPGFVIGVTGTKGKGTTSSLIFHILKQGGFKPFLAGNIGKPVFQLLLKAKPQDLLIYELSSHQLQALKQSPQLAVFLNIFPDHLDYYQDFQDYVSAKSNITRHQSKDDFLIFNETDQQVKKIAEQSKAIKIPISLEKARQEIKKIIPLNKIPLLGDFNLLNIFFAVQVGQIFNVNKENIKKGILAFKGLPHRLQYVGKFKGIDFYNNSMATIPASTIEDLHFFKTKNITLIAGGSEKGSDYHDLCKELLKSKVKNLILFPSTGEKIKKEIEKNDKNKKIKLFLVDSMQTAVKTAFSHTKRGEICLLSPASASFGLFKDYQERGDLFIKYAKKPSK